MYWTGIQKPANSIILRAEGQMAVDEGGLLGFLGFSGHVHRPLLEHGYWLPFAWSGVSLLLHGAPAPPSFDSHRPAHAVV